MNIRYFSKSFRSPAAHAIIALAMAAGLMLSISGCGKDKEIIRYVQVPPPPVSLSFPPSDTVVTTNNPTFFWHPTPNVVRYQLQVSRASDFITTSINTHTSDTTYTTITSLRNGTHYWRVRGQSPDSIWGDWSDAQVRVINLNYSSQVPSPVSLAFPQADSFITDNNPTFAWHPATAAVRYQIQVSGASDFVSNSIDAQTSDTVYTTVSQIPNGTFFWRVRGRNQDSVWSDWSEAAIWTFYKSDYVNYFYPVSQTYTRGIPQDVTLRNDTAYVADGQSFLTMVDVSNPYAPFIMRNIDPIDDDFAKGVYISPRDTFPYAYVADLDGRVYVVSIRDTTGLMNFKLGSSQNLEDLTGIYKSDTLWILAVSGLSQRKLGFNQVPYSPYPEQSGYAPFDVDMPADARGIYADTEYAYVACSMAGLRIVDVRDIYNVMFLSSAWLPGEALSVDVKGDYAYVASDRAGLFVVNISDKNHPAVVRQVNTSGRTKDVQVIGNYAFIADGSGGLKVIDATNPDSAHFVAAYATPYAYGLWADSSYIYLCDRDNGLLIFENRVFR